MRELPILLKDHLVSGATTLCQCWRIERSDGVVQGFTDHDQILAFDNVEFQASSGLTASETVSSLGLSVDSNEVDGALQSDVISEEALHRGAYDGARVSIFLVNWQDVSVRILLRSTEIGEVTCEDGAFRAELRGIMQRLNHVSGRLFENTCDADLGDDRCRVDLDRQEFKADGTIIDLLDTQTFTVIGLTDYSAGWFDRGLLRWTSGDNLNQQVEIDLQLKAGNQDKLRIWLPMSSPIAVGDTFSVIAGCDKQFVTCREKFTNSVNYQGFPHIPGNDVVFRNARSDGNNRGQALVD